MNRKSSLGTALLAVLVAGMPTEADAQILSGTANDNHWHWDLSLPVWAPAIDGTVSFRGIPEQKVESSISDIIKNLDFAFLGHAELRRNRLGLATGLLYMSLEAKVPTSGPILGRTNPRANIKLLIVEGFGFYRLATIGSQPDNQGFVDVLAGARYNAMQTQIKGDVASSTKQTFDFTDGLAGLRGYVGLGRRWGLRGRLDLATFGSDFTWNLESSLAWRASRHWTIDGSYHQLDVNYDKGEGSDRKLLKLKIFGPVLTFRYVT